jgi:hypothetical protein
LHDAQRTGLAAALAFNVPFARTSRSIANQKPKITTKAEQYTSRPELQMNSEQKPILFRQPA